MDGFLNANDFRVATYPKNEVSEVDGKSRAFVVWDACSARPQPLVCERPEVKLTYSDDLGATWSETRVLSKKAGNYFPTISSDHEEGGSLAVAYFTNRYDPAFENAQDAELVTLDAQTAAVTHRQRLTAVSNQPEADPMLGGAFIGDYIEVLAKGGEAYLHYNANYRKERLLEDGLAVPQQDNYLVKAGL